MNKYKELRKRILKILMMAMGAVAVAAMFYTGVVFMAAGVTEDKESAESRFNSENSLFLSLSEQMNKSGMAEKRYALIQEERATPEYIVDLKILKEFLADARLKFKLDNLRIKSVTSAVSDKPELANFNYDVKVFSRLRITFAAVSDVHVFSFLDHFRKAMSGLVRIDLVEINRLSDFTDQSLNAIKNSGTMPLNVDAKIEFTWIGLAPKEAKKSPKPPTP